MNITVKITDLAAALKLLAKVAPKKFPKPILSACKIVAFDGLITISATDLERHCQIALSGVADVGGVAVVNTAQLLKMLPAVGKKSDDTITIADRDSADARIYTITARGVTATIFGYDPAEYPVFLWTDYPVCVALPFGAVDSALERTMFATAKAHSHYAISGVLFERDSAGAVNFVATDGHRLARVVVPATPIADGFSIIPKTTCALIRAMKCADDTAVEFTAETSADAEATTYIYIRAGNVKLYSACVPGNFPKYNDIFPKVHNTLATADADALAGAIRAVCHATTAENPGVRFDFWDKRINTYARNPEAGEAQSHCAAELSGNGVAIGFNPELILDALDVCAGNVRMELTGTNRPMRMTNHDFDYLLMPIDMDIKQPAEYTAAPTAEPTPEATPAEKPKRARKPRAKKADAAPVVPADSTPAATVEPEQPIVPTPEPIKEPAPAESAPVADATPESEPAEISTPEHIDKPNCAVTMGNDQLARLNSAFNRPAEVSPEPIATPNVTADDTPEPTPTKPRRGKPGRIDAIVAELRAARDANGVATITAKQCASIIRARLAETFAGIKFSVRSDYNSINIGWTDGPKEQEVNAIAGDYKFGGFDGSIDLAYSSMNWLLPDGSMCLAHTDGTAGSRGYHPAQSTDCPTPGAFIVRYGPRYVFCNRDISPAYIAELTAKAAAYYGFEYNPAENLHNQRTQHGDYIVRLAHEYESRILSPVDV